MLVRFEENHGVAWNTAIINGPRVLVDEMHGDAMTVVERRAEGVAGARGPSCLMFSTERGFMRLWDFPANWMDLSDDELIELSERKRRPRIA